MKAQINRGVLAGGIDPSTFHSFTALKGWLEQFGRDGLYNTVEMYHRSDPAKAQEYRALCSAYDLKTVYISGVELKLEGMDLSSPDEQRRCKASQAMQDRIDDAYAFGAGKCLLICGGPMDKNADQECCYRQLLRSMGEIYQRANRAKDTYGYAMRIGIEPFSTQREPYFFLGSTDTTLRLAEDLKKQGNTLEITYDLAHYYLLGEDVVESFRRLAPHITHIHLSNCVMDHPDHPLNGDKHPLFGIADSCVDEETLDWWIRSVQETGFFDREQEVTISYEVITAKDQIPMEVYRQSNAVYERVLRRAGLMEGRTVR